MSFDNSKTPRQAGLLELALASREACQEVKTQTVFGQHVNEVVVPKASQVYDSVITLHEHYSTVFGKDSPLVHNVFYGSSAGPRKGEPTLHEAKLTELMKELLFKLRNWVKELKTNGWGGRFNDKIEEFSMSLGNILNLVPRRVRREKGDRSFLVEPFVEELAKDFKEASSKQNETRKDLRPRYRS